ncbi:MAG: hypothetical protein J6R99_04555, partial [Alphaproteobacteria bacterium]|nr:hypothetical protein [Alphaproteobacteria bacterium]
MKKLTAGVFATILGLTAMGAASAAMPEGYTSVATTNYVKEAVGAAKTEASSTYATKQTVQDLSTTVQDAVVDISDLGTDVRNLQSADTTLQTYIDTLAGKVYTKTETDGFLNNKADKSMVGTIPTTATATTVVGYVDEKTANIASDATVSALEGRVTTAEGKITTAESDISTIKTQQATQDGKISALETASATHATKTELTTAKNELQTNINGVSDVASEAKDKANANAEQIALNTAGISGLRQDVDGLSDSLNETYATDQELSTAVADLASKDYVDQSQDQQNTEIARTYATQQALTDGLNSKVDTTTYTTDQSAQNTGIQEAKAAAAAADGKAVAA